MYQNSNSANWQQIVWNRYLSNCLKHEKEGVNNSKIQKEAKVEELEEGWNGLQLWFLKTR